MLSRFAEDADHIYLALGPTDFRKQTAGLVALVTSRFGMDAYDEKLVFIFCNRKRNSIKVLRYDRNGFVLAAKTLLDKMKFQWPRNEDELREIDYTQIKWLLQGLEIEQKKAHHPVMISLGNSCY